MFPFSGYKASLKDRLMSRVEKIPESGCWVYMGVLSKEGYGRIRTGARGSKLLLAHRASYELLVGPIEAGKLVHHICYVKCCINPGHLSQATKTENALDAFRGPLKGYRCRKGHDMTDQSNVFFQGKYRCCFTCRRNASKRQVVKRSAVRKSNRGLQ